MRRPTGTWPGVRPNLKLFYSEGQIGWLPYILERADDIVFSQGVWTGVRERCSDRPSSYFRNHMYGCFFRDEFGLDNIAAIGVDNVTFETDYPHNDTTWPHTRKYAIEMTENLDDLTVWKVIRGNAIQALHLPPEAPPRLIISKPRSSCPAGAQADADRHDHLGRVLSPGATPERSRPSPPLALVIGAPAGRSWPDHPAEQTVAPAVGDR